MSELISILFVSLDLVRKETVTEGLSPLSIRLKSKPFRFMSAHSPSRVQGLLKNKKFDIVIYRSSFLSPALAKTIETLCLLNPSGFTFGCFSPSNFDKGILLRLADAGLDGLHFLEDSHVGSVDRFVDAMMFSYRRYKMAKPDSSLDVMKDFVMPLKNIRNLAGDLKYNLQKSQEFSSLSLIETTSSHLLSLLKVEGETNQTPQKSTRKKVLCCIGLDQEKEELIRTALKNHSIEIDSILPEGLVAHVKGKRVDAAFFGDLSPSFGLEQIFAKKIPCLYFGDPSPSFHKILGDGFLRAVNEDQLKSADLPKIVSQACEWGIALRMETELIRLANRKGPLRVLVADAAPESLQLIRSFLKKTPFVVESITDGESLVTKDRYDVILLDNGSEKVKWSQKMEKNPTPIIALNELGAKESSNQFHLLKSIDKGDLIHAIIRHGGQDKKTQ